jgi:CBS domain/BON domain
MSRDSCLDAMGRHVAGVVSEADLLAAQDQDARAARAGKARLPWRRAAGQHPGRIAEDLMSAPAITIHPDAPIPRAASLMHHHHVKRLPVTDPDGKLLGIVARRDLLSAFLRPDAQIASAVRELLTEVLPTDPSGVSVSVHEGVVILTVPPGAAGQPDLLPVAVRLIWDIDGVIDVIEMVGSPAPVGG